LKPAAAIVRDSPWGPSLTWSNSGKDRPITQ